ncbi:outer membrane beta-barrel protein [Listeria ivanovii subsp. ivanovii]
MIGYKCFKKKQRWMVLRLYGFIKYHYNKRNKTA